MKLGSYNVRGTTVHHISNLTQVIFLKTCLTRLVTGHCLIHYNSWIDIFTVGVITLQYLFRLAKLSLTSFDIFFCTLLKSCLRSSSTTSAVLLVLLKRENNITMIYMTLL